jgi:hypothetical protein
MLQRWRRRACCGRTHDHADHHHDGQCQQAEHQHVGEGFAHAQRVGQPGQAQACGQAAQHGAPGLLGGAAGVAAG